MKKTYRLTESFAFLGILILILDGKTALSGAQSGVDLCIRTVIPSLFPFFLLSAMLTSALSGTSLPLLRPITRFFEMPQGTEAILLTGFLGGYPTGAQCIASAYRSNQINKTEADRLLSFCSNAGPAFLFGMIAPMFSDLKAAFLLWGIHITSALLVAALLPASKTNGFLANNRKNVSFSRAMHTALYAMATVCGWVIVFRSFLAFLDRWFLWLVPSITKVSIYGILELSNGCIALSSISDLRLRFVLCSGMLAWGGLCVVLQTFSVAEGLSMKSYIKGKMLQTIFSLLLSTSFVLNIWFPVAALMVFLVLLLRKTQKRGRNPEVIGV